MKNILTLVCLMCVTTPVLSQSDSPLTLAYCYQRSTENYPLVKQRQLIEKTKEYSVSNAQKGIYPTVMLYAQQSYQSDVTKVPLPTDIGIAVPTLSKNQYKMYGDITATLYDGGTVRNQKQFHEANAHVEQQSLEAELYQLKERVNQLYFGILLIDGQVKQNELLQQNITIGLNKTNASIAGGTALKSSADVLQAESLKTQQRRVELDAARRGYLDALSLLIGQELNDTTSLQKPVPVMLASEVTRPEISVYSSQLAVLDVQSNMLRTRNAPKLSAFAQVGYGRPALNMLNTEADSYYIAGFRLQWNLTSFYTFRKEKELIDISRQNINLRQEAFLFNTQYTLKQQNAEVYKLNQLLASDDSIITLRTRITTTASSQLENGVIDSSDYLREVNAEDQARQNKVVHEIQSLMAQYTQQTTAGN